MEHLHDDVEATGMVGSKVADLHFDHDAAAFAEILEKPSGAEGHLLARARRRSGSCPYSAGNAT
ncbi:hypothetical protein [Nannocystis exedens]|uniref:hypothetical protein n=1 Tax=Nannocystis exedens TaxID=54 RepID=UPI0011601B6E|nr:hypothetical protein [Nannocystis exedens]